MGSAFKYQFSHQQKWMDARIIFDTGTTVNYLVSEVYKPIKKYVSAKTPKFAESLHHVVIVLILMMTQYDVDDNSSKETFEN